MTSKTMIGQKYSVTAYVDPETFDRIEEERGDVKRSTYLSKLITNVMTA